MTNDKNLLIVFAKLPEPGKVKTRLGIGVGDDCACELYESFLKATISTAALVDARVRIDITPEGTKSRKYFSQIFQGVETSFQNGRDLGERLQNSFESAFGAGFSKVCIIGSDSPDLPSRLIDDAFKLLNESDAVFGPCPDGGYYLVGLSRPASALFNNIPWSTGRVLDESLKAAKNENLSTSLLHKWPDIDDVCDTIQLRDRLKASENLPPHHKTLLENILNILSAENPFPEDD